MFMAPTPSTARHERIFIAKFLQALAKTLAWLYTGFFYAKYDAGLHTSRVAAYWGYAGIAFYTFYKCSHIEP
jgi:hypothetical protein